MKPIIPYEEHSPELKIDEKIQIDHPNLKFDFTLPNKDSVLSGLACLSGKTFAAIDYYSSYLYVFRQNKKAPVTSLRLKMEPKGMTKTHTNTFAISFPFERIIRIFEHQADKTVDLVEETIDLNEVGKPFSISFSQERYAVEIGQLRQGFIAVIDIKGKVLHRILNNNYSFGYFTGNNLRLALNTKKQLFYTSAIGQKTVYCVDFNGNIKWHTDVPSPREIHLVPSSGDSTRILVASKIGNIIYEIIGKDKDMNTKNPEADCVHLKDIQLPEYISYDKNSKTLCVGMENGKISVYHFPDDL